MLFRHQHILGGQGCPGCGEKGTRGTWRVYLGSLTDPICCRLGERERWKQSRRTRLGWLCQHPVNWGGRWPLREVRWGGGHCAHCQQVPLSPCPHPAQTCVPLRDRPGGACTSPSPRPVRQSPMPADATCRRGRYHQWSDGRFFDPFRLLGPGVLTQTHRRESSWLRVLRSPAWTVLVRRLTRTSLLPLVMSLTLHFNRLTPLPRGLLGCWG